MYAAARAIDLNSDTWSHTVPSTDDISWLQVKLNNTYCIEHVVWYKYGGDTYLSWTCTSSDCSNCEGSSHLCNSFSLTVGTVETSSSLPALSDCSFGDTVRIQKTKGFSFSIRELEIISKEGEKRQY